MKMLTVTLDQGSLLVLTDHAIILLSRPQTAERMASRMLGAVGAIAQASADRKGDRAAQGRPRLALDSLQAVTQCLAAEVPSEFVRHPEWPAVGASHPAAIYPKAVFSELRVSMLRGLVARVKGGDGRLLPFAAIPFWRNGTVKTFLASAGYPVA